MKGYGQFCPVAKAAEIFAEFCRDEPTPYSGENITNCRRLLIRRGYEEVEAC